ncbi:MAG TPA: ABC transporter permease [Vicinamibacterales bacterium]|jgi:ABC-2 type transport system permease protein
MRKVGALVRAAWLTALSYRLQSFFSFVGLIVAVLPLYFITGALQPLMQGVIKTEAPEYFGYLIVGIVTFTFVQTAVGAMHGALGGEISTGSFEALLATPTSIPTLLAGMIGQAFTMTAFRAVVILAAAMVLGAKLALSGVIPALLALVLIVASYLPFGIVAAALVLGFRTTGPFPGLILTGSALFGGVYYPTQVIPSWLERVSTFIPLTYGLRALRRSLLDGAPLSASIFDLGVLCVATAVMLALSLAAFSWTMRYAKRAGTLAQY